MKRLAAVAALVIAAALSIAAAKADGTQQYSRTLYIVNNSSVLSDAAVADALPALQANVQDLEKYWGGSNRLAVVSKAPKHSWAIYLQDDLDVMAQGYHSTTKGGIPFGRVMVTVGTELDAYWTVTASHEIDELLVDPFINRGALVGNRWYLVEAADPVEDNFYAYTRPTASGGYVYVTDFPTPAWYKNPSNTGGVYDFARHCKRPLQVLPGGYVSYWMNGRWAQEFNKPNPRWRGEWDHGS